MGSTWLRTDVWTDVWSDTWLESCFPSHCSDDMTSLTSYQSKTTPKVLLKLYRSQAPRGAARGAAKGTVTVVAPLAVRYIRILPGRELASSPC